MQYQTTKRNNAMKPTKSVHVHKSNSTDKMIVKHSRICYGHIHENLLIQTRHASDSVMQALLCFARKNELTIVHNGNYAN